MRKKEYMDKHHFLLKILKEKKKIAIAFSGGIDSTLLAYTAKQAKIETLLITITSPLFSKFDEEMTVKIADDLGLSHILITDNLDVKVTRNPINRCYYCRKNEAKIWKKIAEKHGYSTVTDGCNIDDIQDNRPGISACNELGIWHPLAEANITKSDIRNIAKDIGISIWDRPSNACLASRIQFGEEISFKKLQMIEEAEDYLRCISPQVRVRLHQNIAGIELPICHLNAVLKMRERIISFMRKIGFVYITLDLGGYISGSMHEDIAKGNV